MDKSETKASRLLQFQALLWTHPRALTQSEISTRLGVHRSTISKYVPYSPGDIFIFVDIRWQWKINHSADLVNVHFNLHEVTAVHRSARLIATQIDRKNPHAGAALRKLSVALEKLAPHVSRHMAQLAGAMNKAA